ncbi:MAG: metallophosphoesterase family protein [Eubacterium sp.]
MKKKIVIVLIVLAVILLVAGIAAAGVLCSGSISQINRTKIKEYNTDNSDFKVAVISDTQLPPTKEQLDESDTYVKNLRNTLTVLKNRQVDMILFAGDIGDLGTEFAFQTYMDTVDQVFGDDKPIIQTIMGNHDYWSKNALTYRPHRAAYKKVIGESPWTHYVVNGYHFIGASPDTGSMPEGYRLTAKWLDTELQRASEDSQGKPIFVMTHNQPKDTCYGSDEWGDTTLNAVLSKYPNVISLSGHSHFSILDERSVWQGEYTVMSTQSLSYTELETGKENGTIPPNADATPMGYIFEFTQDSITVHRMNFADGEMGKEEKADTPWVFSLPYSNDGKYSFEPRKNANLAPVISNTAGTAEVTDNKTVLTFDAAYDDDFVHSYKVVIDGRETKYYFSDFYNGIDNMNKTVKIEIDGNDGNSHTYEIYAVDSWGQESRECVTFS